MSCLHVISRFVFLITIFTVTANAQMGAQPLPQSGVPTSPSPASVGSTMSGVPMHGGGGNGSVQISVESIKDDKTSRLDHPAVVRLYEEHSKLEIWQPTSKGSDATFDQLGPGKYDFDISALGYLSARKQVELSSAGVPVHLDVVLRADPDAVEFSATDPTLSAKAAKETNKGVADLESGNLKDAQKHLESALKEAPSSAHANFLVGYSYYLQNQPDQAQTFLTKASTLDPKDVQSLNLLSRIYLGRKDYAAAKTTAEQAVAANPDNATAHGILADVDLNEKDYKNALMQADLALDKGKSHASNAQIVRGQALANIGHNDDAIQALKLYLDSAPDSAAAPQVKQWIDILEQRSANSPAAKAAQPQKQ
jgi:regulator of sirC expression with transglutaminase-like and TPR domain